ncbi:hypothetical protein ACFU8W_31350 [Streptomyces sp. NPDC057565]|uniref:hypothetical protein n=1 Tax=Streptomyces sp. NPDC057565 TaxID=3346169 RepID=UPI003689C460
MTREDQELIRTARFSDLPSCEEEATQVFAAQEPQVNRGSRIRRFMEARRKTEPLTNGPRVAAARNYNKYVIIDRFGVPDRSLFRRALHAYLDVVDSRSAAEQELDVEAVRLALSQQLWAVAIALESLRVPSAQYEELRKSITSAAGNATATEHSNPLIEARQDLIARVERLELYAAKVRQSDKEIAESAALTAMQDAHSWIDGASRAFGEGVAADVTIDTAALARELRKRARPRKS